MWPAWTACNAPQSCCVLPGPRRERGKLWDPSSKERWGHDAFEALERGDAPGEDFLDVRGRNRRGVADPGGEVAACQVAQAVPCGLRGRPARRSQLLLCASH